MKIAHLTIAICFAAASAAQPCNSQDDPYLKMRPDGVARKLVIRPDVKVKLKVAFSASLDVESLADPGEFQSEDLDAKRAIREARAVVETKDERTVLNDIEMLRLMRETCRPVTTVEEFKECYATANLWADRVVIELALRTGGPNEKSKPQGK